MCNLYRMTKSVDEVARLFGGAGQTGNAGSDVYPGYPGYVAEGGKVRQMTWGFPLSMRGKSGQMLKPRPVNNARTDKLQGPFWKASFIERRCLIPVTAWAEAEGPKGGKTRSWFSVPGSEVFWVGGIWRSSAEWGDVYSMIMTEAIEAASAEHQRMPVIIAANDSEAWMSAPPESAFELCVPWQGDLLLERTGDPWVQRKAGA